MNIKYHTPLKFDLYDEDHMVVRDGMVVKILK